MIASLIATVLFAFSILCGHRAARVAGGVDANLWRLTCSSTFLGIWSFGFGIGLDGAAFPWFFLSGLIGFGLGDVALFQALPRLGAPLTSTMTQCLAPPFAAVAEWLWLGQRVSLGQTAAIGVVLFGVGLALFPAAGTAARSGRTRDVPGLIWGLIAAMGTAGGAVISRKAFAVAAQANESIDGANAAFQRVIAGLAVAGLTWLFVRWRQHDYSTRPDQLPLMTAGAREKWSKLWPWVLANALFGSTLGISFMQWALSTDTASAVVLAIIATTPLVVIPLARWIEHEHVSHRTIVGCFIAVAGVMGLLLAR
jgi:drug/metabolite transporter (DMT)-like permease